MNNKNTRIIGLVVAVLLCGCPGLFALCWGGLTAIISFVPGADINIGGSSDPSAALSSGITSLCIGILFLIVTAAAGYFALRKQPDSSSDVNSAPPPV